MTDDSTDYSREYSEESFSAKLATHAKVAGKDVIEKALWLFYAFKEEDTPKWAKATILGALGYLIAPIDAIPDLLPVAGYADDLGVLAVAVTTVVAHIDEKVKNLASAKLRVWFGD